MKRYPGKRISDFVAAFCAAVTLCASLSMPVRADQVIGFQPKQPETEAPKAAAQPSAEDQPPAADVQPSADDQTQQGQENADSPEQAAETTTEEEFVAPDTYPAYLAPQYARETFDGISFLESEDGSHVMIVGFRGDAAEGGRVVIPEEIDGLPVTEIAESAFAGNDVIKYLSIPDSVTVIGEFAVSRASNLETAVIPKTMTKMPAGMFEGCSSLRTVELPPELTDIGDVAFSGCTMLGRMYVPASVRHIGVDAFAACERLLLDCADNSFAAGYAEVNGIETVGSETWNSMLIKMAVITAVLGAAVFAAPKIWRRIRKKKS
ncbi:MAG: leucine-rich repeat domain-containing protein [Clostridiales bacterium]|nr:leucine-rich repeat domain-containing protein [Clostridiales bacterium]